MAGIIYSDYYLPEDKAAVSEFVDSSICSAFTKQYKLEFVYVEKKKSPVEIFDGLIEDFFAKSGIAPGEISHVIYAASTNLMQGDVCVPFYLQSRHQMTSAAVMVLNHGCNSAMQGIQIADALVNTGKANKVMILTISYGTLTQNRFISTSVIGDGAGIAVVGKEGVQTAILDFMSVSDGRFSVDTYDKKQHERDSLSVVRDGSSLVQNLLKKNNVEMSDIKMIIPQNLNFLGLFAQARLLGVGLDKIYTGNISRGGHLIDVDTIRNYADYRRSVGANQSGEKFILYATSMVNGVNITYDAMLMSE